MTIYNPNMILHTDNGTSIPHGRRGVTVVLTVSTTVSCTPSVWLVFVCSLCTGT